MSDHFRFTLHDERDEREDEDLSSLLTPEHEAWLAGALARLYERMVEAQQSAAGAPTEHAESPVGNEPLGPGMDGKREGDADGSASPDSTGAAGTPDFGGSASWSGGADFNF